MTAAGDPETTPLINTGSEISTLGGPFGYINERVDPNFPFVSERDGTIPSLSIEQGDTPAPRPNCEISIKTLARLDPLCLLVTVL